MPRLDDTHQPYLRRRLRLTSTSTWQTRMFCPTGNPARSEIGIKLRRPVLLIILSSANLRRDMPPAGHITARVLLPFVTPADPPERVEARCGSGARRWDVLRERRLRANGSAAPGGLIRRRGSSLNRNSRPSEVGQRRVHPTFRPSIPPAPPQAGQAAEHDVTRGIDDDQQRPRQCRSACRRPSRQRGTSDCRSNCQSGSSSALVVAVARCVVGPL